MSPETLIPELAALVLDAAEKTAPEGGLSISEPLFGPQARLGLDSLDALQISMAIQARYSLRMPDSKDTRRALASLGDLAAHVSHHLASQRS